jgi:triphosphatase
LNTTRQRNQEIEVKFTCDAATLHGVLKSELLRAPIYHHVKSLHATYFDTSNLRLRKAHSVLRVRKSDGKDPMLCFKSLSSTTASAFQRLEFEVPTPDGHLNTSLFDASTAKLLERLLGGKPLQAQFDVNVKRQAFLVSYRGADIEISADEGDVSSATKTAPIIELELELKSGEEAGLYDLAARLSTDFPLSLSFITKSERGFRLIGKSWALPVVAPPIELSCEMAMDEVIHISLSRALYQVTTNWHTLADEHSPEAVHQMRIALRRMRTFLSVFSLSHPCPEFGALKTEARAIAQILGKARSLDVLAQAMPKFVVTSKLSQKDVRSLVAIIARQRALAAKEAFELFNGAAAAQFILRTQRLIATRGWNDLTAGNKILAAPPSSEEFVRLALNKLYKRVLRRGRKFETLSSEKLHAVRLALKALSSTAGAFTALTGRRKNASDFEAALLNLQQGLGQLNDSVFALQFCEELALEKSDAVNKAGKTFARELKRKQPSLKEKLHKRWREFKKIRPSWR